MVAQLLPILGSGGFALLVLFSIIFIWMKTLDHRMFVCSQFCREMRLQANFYEGLTALDPSDENLRGYHYYQARHEESHDLFVRGKFGEVLRLRKRVAIEVTEVMEDGSI